MSYEGHQRAKRVFNELERMDPALRLDALRDEEHESHRTPCSAGLTAVVFRRLGIDVDEWDIYWEKLYRRPVARVCRFIDKAEEEGPEHYNALLSAFAKRVCKARETNRGGRVSEMELVYQGEIVEDEGEIVAPPELCRYRGGRMVIR